jgi:hypothetical protein
MQTKIRPPAEEARTTYLADACPCVLRHSQCGNSLIHKLCACPPEHNLHELLIVAAIIPVLQFACPACSLASARSPLVEHNIQWKHSARTTFHSATGKQAYTTASRVMRPERWATVWGTHTARFLDAVTTKANRLSLPEALQPSYDAAMHSAFQA